MKIVYYYNFLFGVFLKFGKIDDSDLNLLIEDFEKKFNLKLDGYFDHTELISDINTFLSSNNILIDSIDRHVKERLLGPYVIDYFNKLDIEAFKKEKEEKRVKVLNNANVLLLSDSQIEYDELIKYGFKNVDCFKSIIRANQYFESHPEELNKYHIIIEGNQESKNIKLERFELENKIMFLRSENHLVFSKIYRDKDAFTCEYLKTDKNQKRWEEIEHSSYYDCFNRIVDNALVNHTLEKEEKKIFVPIEDYINKERLPLPTKKSDLKILFLGTSKLKEITLKVAEEQGLNLTFNDKDFLSHIGEYDIIVSNDFPMLVSDMFLESCEQCKDTGRELTILVNSSSNHQIDTDTVDSELGKVNLSYTIGGLNCPLDYNSYDTVLEYDYCNKENEEYYRIENIFESVINIYNQVLLQNGKQPLSDLDQINQKRLLFNVNKQKKDQS